LKTKKTLNLHKRKYNLNKSIEADDVRMITNSDEENEEGEENEGGKNEEDDTEDENLEAVDFIDKLYNKFLVEKR
jgi:hypothetical protein